MTVLFLAAIHAIPILIVGLVTGSRSTLNLVTLFMCVIAVIVGGSRYAFIDLLVVGISYLIIVSNTEYSTNKPSTKQQSNIETVEEDIKGSTEVSCDSSEHFGFDIDGRSIKPTNEKLSYKKKERAQLLISKSNPLKFFWGRKYFTILYEGNRPTLECNPYEEAIFTMALFDQGDLSRKAYMTVAKNEDGEFFRCVFSDIGSEIFEEQNKLTDNVIVSDIKAFISAAIYTLDTFERHLREGPFVLALKENILGEYVESRLSSMERLTADSLLIKNVNYFEVPRMDLCEMILYKGNAPSIVPHTYEGAIFTMAYFYYGPLSEYVTAAKDENGDFFLERYHRDGYPNHGSRIYKDVDPDIYTDIKIFIETATPFFSDEYHGNGCENILLLIKKQLLALSNDT